MAWGVKYRLSYYDIKENLCRHDFLIENYSGEITYLTGFGIDCVKFDNPATEEFTHLPLRGIAIEFDLMERVDGTYSELTAYDRASWVKSYVDDVLICNTWTIAGNYETSYNLGPKKVTITSADGIGFLRAYPWADKAISTEGFVTVKTVIKTALDFIGFEVNVHESMALKWDNMEQAFGTLEELPVWDQLYVNVYNFYNESEDSFSSMYDMLSDILLHYESCLFQRNGAWYISHFTQLTQAVITYNQYDHEFTYVTEVEIDYTVSLTSSTGNPLVVPINMSLHRELIRPLSSLKITNKDVVHENLMRYKKEESAYTKIGTFSLSFNQDVISMGTTGVPPTLNGIRYYLGYLKMGTIAHPLGQSLPIYKFNVSGTLFGTFSALLVIYNVTDFTTYFFRGTSSPGWTTSRAPIVSVTKNTVDSSGNPIYETFSEEVEIHGSSIVDEGPVYLYLCPPYSSYGGGYVELEYNGLSLEMMYPPQGQITSTRNFDLHTVNTKEINLTCGHFYKRVMKLLTPVYEYEILDTNFYFEQQDDQDSQIVSYTSWGFLYYLSDSIMKIYSDVKWKLIGTVYSDLIDVGSIIYYKNKVYKVNDIKYNQRRCQAQLILLQIGISEGFLVTESGDYILTESSGHILIE